jgi:nucleoside-diphosphate kinase
MASPHERTFVLFKPDCLQRRLMGRVLARFEDKGLNVVALKMLQVNSELAGKHYKEHVNKSFYPALESFITASPVVAAVLEGPSAIRVVRSMLGPTNGLEAPPGTVRGDFGSSRQMNLIHASDGPEAAAREIAIYFTDNEIHAYEPTIGSWLRAADE